MADNPFTIMRQNIEAALEGHPGLAGVAIRQWDDERTQRVDNPAADRAKWIRVETVNVGENPYWANTTVEMRHRLQIVVALPEGAGLKQEDIEDLYYQVAKALRPLSRDEGLATQIPALEGFEFTGGDVGLTQDEQPKRRATTDGMVWFVAGTIEAVYHEPI